MTCRPPDLLRIVPQVLMFEDFDFLAKTISLPGESNHRDAKSGQNETKNGSGSLSDRNGQPRQNHEYDSSDGK
jgi:hypothetical protein